MKQLLSALACSLAVGMATGAYAQTSDPSALTPAYDASPPSSEVGPDAGRSETLAPGAASPGADDEVQLDEVVIGTGQKELPPPAVVETQTAKDIARINAVDSADVMKFVPNVHVRKLQAGNINRPLALRGNASTTAGPRTLVLVDGLQLTNYISGGMGDSPKWQMVSPIEIESFDVIYGPFSAAYGGNSFGGTVLITTRMPDKLELRAGLGGFLQTFNAFATDVRLPGYDANLSVGNRWRKLSYMVLLDRVQAADQPISFYSAGTAGATTGNPVSGAVADRDAKGADRITVGSQGKMKTTNNTARLKLAYDPTPSSQVRLSLGFWDNRTEMTGPESYLRDASGNPVYSGPVDIDGRGYTLASNLFSYQKTHKQEMFYGVTYKLAHASGFKAWAGVSYYDTLKDLTLVSKDAPPVARDGGLGTVTDKDSGSLIADVKLGHTFALGGTHTLGAGGSFSRFDLQSDAWNASDWLRDVRATLSKHEQGSTQTHAVFLDDTWTLLPWWSVYLGGRYEWWRAFDGNKAIDTDTGRVTTALPEAKQHNFSPKLSTTFSPLPMWSLRASLGVANRYPTVGELFYGGINATGIISAGNPDLRRERNVAKDITVSRVLPDGGMVRVSLYQDDVTSAILSQTNVNTNTTYYQNVGKVRTRGAEAAANVRKLPLPGLGFQGSVALNDSEILENENVPASVGKKFPRVPLVRAKLAVDYTWADVLMASVAGSYASRAYYNLDNSDTGGGYGAVDSYLVFDARVHYRIDRRLLVNAGVDNITNRTYYEFHPYPGRTFFAGIKASY